MDSDSAGVMPVYVCTQRRPSIKIEEQTTRRKEGDAQKKRKARIKIK